jgi:hypothetical protein
MFSKATALFFARNQKHPGICVVLKIWAFALARVAVSAGRGGVEVAAEGVGVLGAKVGLDAAQGAGRGIALAAVLALGTDEAVEPILANMAEDVF